MDLKRARGAASAGGNRPDDRNGDVESLLKENNSLKTVVSMMRKEMETTAASTETEVREKSTLPRDMVLEQQLLQCRSYLDLLLKKRDSTSNGFGYRGDEAAFLRSKYRDLHRAADELREENARCASL